MRRPVAAMPVLDVLDQPANGVGTAHGLLKVQRTPVEQVNDLHQHQPISHGRIGHAKIGSQSLDVFPTLLVAPLIRLRTAHRLPLPRAPPPWLAYASAAGLS